MDGSCLRTVTLEDKYALERGTVYLSGIQALARLPMLQQDRDRRAGLHTAGYVSGYRGSPLAGLDQALWRAREHLRRHDIVFQPGLNEDLAATAIWGSQQVGLRPGARFDGVFGMWYGKGPGLDRSADVFKHANAAGTARLGGVLLLAGDDHAAKSSSVAHQSEHLLKACGIPVLFPANVQEYLDFGLHAWAMSRWSGLWVSMKCVTDVVESSASVEVDPERVSIMLPQDFALPPDGLNLRWPDPPLAQEARMMDYKWYAALAYVRANRLNRVVIGSPDDRFGIMAAGKSYLDVRQALVDLGLDEHDCHRLGIRVFKVGCSWPLEAQATREFATGLEEILVVEEKRQILEYAIKEELYNWREDVRPRVYGKFDERDNAGGEWSMPRGQWLLPARHELSPALIARAIAARLLRVGVPQDVEQRVRARIEVIDAKEREAGRHRVTDARTPWFCPGCPHNTSTRVPEGSQALAGIGCHYMAQWMDRDTSTFTQMGGEGVSWIGQMHFTSHPHMFANLGDGTYFHSGLLAIRAAVAAHANITYKILFNDAVAMTGGQPVDGTLTVPMIARQVQAEGVARTVVVSAEPQRFAAAGELPADVAVHHRDDLDAVQRTLRDITGTTVLIYDQVCATELRRRRKRGKAPDPARRAFINAAVCEGCGDCSAVSNCLAIEPLETPLGTRRQINQSACNKDFSCLKGFCPSFVSAEGARLHAPRGISAGIDDARFGRLPEPALPVLTDTSGIVVTGVGGTGVVTVGALLGMAAHLDGHGVTVLDMTGLAQKGGAVLSHVQIAPAGSPIYATRIATGEARLMIGCDAIVSASDEALSRLRLGLTRAVVNGARTPTADFIGQRDWHFPDASILQDIGDAIGDACEFLAANSLAVQLLGDAIFANPLMLGYAWQRGWLPLSRAALLRAIELNDVDVERNQLAFQWGRLAAGDPAAIRAALGDAAADKATLAPAAAAPEDPAALLARRLDVQQQRLAAWQDVAYAQRYRQVITRLCKAERGVAGSSALRLSLAAVEGLASLMAYKDEYEVARLHTDPAFLAQLRAQFEGEPGRDYQLNWYLAPPWGRRRDKHGHPLKQRYGPWMGLALRVLRHLRWLRGSWLDPFGHSAERRAERRLIADYLALVDEIVATLDAGRLAVAQQLLALPLEIRGFGHIKMAAIASADRRRAELLQRYREPGRS
ncbi:MAG: indolepyruvate ferredoxin oxidoreductase family protein [Pseudomonadota bacterium]|nr:indolepyruvate ferredoxin oxidoreductase family protein [Pseudomonadota bacterium]